MTKSFLRMWVALMLTNQSFIQDPRVNGTNVGLASEGDLKKLRELLVVLVDHIDKPQPQRAFNISKSAPEHKEREMLQIIPESERKQSILDFIAMIDRGDVTIP